MSFELALFESFTDIAFWTNVGILAGTYAIFTIGLQLNVGFTGIINFGQVGFMAIGAYSMAILTTEHGVNFWLSLPLAILITIAFALVVGLSSLRLRADYFAIATIAASEAVRLVLINARDLTNGPLGISGYADGWDEVSDWMSGVLADLGWVDAPSIFPLLIVTWLVVLVLIVFFSRLQRTPWGRVIRAVREDEDAARALGKNAFSYKLQSLSLAATTGAIAGFVLALNLKFLVPEEFLPLVTFIGYTILVLGGLANYWGVALGSVVLWVLIEGLRFLDLPLGETKIAALRFIIVGLLLMALIAFRPQGLSGNRNEMAFRD